MSKKTLLALLISAALNPVSPVFAGDIDELRNELQQMRQDYEQRIADLEQRLAAAENKTQNVSEQVSAIETVAAPVVPANKNSFNPAISMILNGTYASYSNNADAYQISGFPLQGEAGLDAEGFSLGESEITMSASVDQMFYGQATIALADDAGTTEVGIEEAYIDTIGFQNGFNIRAGRFYSPIGYLNEKHVHAWHFADAPLIYRGLFGDQLSTDGIKLSYLLPTDLMIELGATVGSGNQYPGSGNQSGAGDWLLYAKTGGDLGIESSWQASVSHWRTHPDNRAYVTETDDVLFSGDTDISNLSLVYKWAPNGNFHQQNLTVQGEYFYLHDNGSLSQTTSTSYNGKQYGGYIETIYQFTPQWRSGLRYDWLGSDLTASNSSLLSAAGLDNNGHHPQRYSLVLDWLPSEFSRVRAQLNDDQSYTDDDLQLLLQYTVSIGAHGAHNY